MPRKLLRPPIRLRKLYAPLIELCRNIVLTSPSQTSGTASGDKLLTITVKWGLRKGSQYRNVPDLPSDFPTGVVVDRADSSITIRHSVVAILSWAKARGYTTYDSKDLFAQRLPIMMKLAKLELGLDRLASLGDVDIEQHSTSFIEEMLDGE